MQTKLEEHLKTYIRIANHCIQTKKPNKHINEVSKEIINSLSDDKAKIANRLSLCRIPLGFSIPLTAYFTKNDKLILSEISLYAISDFLDGLYSKHIIKHPTKGGSYIDAISDKIGATELLIGGLPLNPSLITNTILEGIIAKTNYNNIKNGIDVKSTKLGKLKMWPLSLALISTYLSKTGLETKKLKIDKETFKAIAGILTTTTAVLEAINILEYNKLKKNR